MSMVFFVTQNIDIFANSNCRGCQSCGIDSTLLLDPARHNQATKFGHGGSLLS